MTPPRPSGSNRRDPWPWHDRAVEAGALFLLVFTPLAFGTVQPWSEAVAELAILGMALAWVFGMVLRGGLLIQLPPGWLPATLFCALVLVQAVPLPSGLVGLLSPWSAGVQQAAMAYTGTTAGLVPLSVAPHATHREAMKLLSVAALFLVLYNNPRVRAQGRRVVWAMIAMGTVVSVFGIVHRMTWNGRFYWIGPEAPHASAFGPFVNRAHFAGLMVVILPMALAMVLAARRDQEDQRPARGWADRLRRWNSRQAGPTGLIPFLILLMGGAALVSGSRGGVVALIASLLAMIGLSARGRHGVGRAGRVAVAAALIVLAGVWISGDIVYGTIERLVEEVGRPAESGRVQIWADALGLWRDAPVLGTGLATFGTAFPRVRTVQAPVVFTHAESDWVQLLTDTGLLGLCLVVAAGVSLALALIRRFRQADDSGACAWPLAGLVALVGAAVQGIGNYNLPILSNWLYLAASLVVALRGGDRLGAGHASGS